MPSFNQGRYLEQAIRSVVLQEYADKELIIVDGGSTDESQEILEKYDEYISYWISETDLGQSDAVNKALANATGDIIGWLNSDDVYCGEVFSAVESAFRSPDIRVVMCSEFGLMEQNGKVYDVKKNSYTTKSRLVRYWLDGGMTINQPSVFFRRDIVSDLPYFLDTGLQYAMDYDLWLRMTMYGPITVVLGHWADYRFHETSKSGTGFDKFFVEWNRVSRRYWGRRLSREWWSHWLSYVTARWIRHPYHSAVSKLNPVLRNRL